MTGGQHLTERDRAVIADALRATVDGPFFPDWEFHTLMGLERTQVRDVLAEWPNTRSDKVAHLAINNALVNLMGYPHGRWDAWPQFSDSTQDELRALLERLGSRGIE
jgi:hypothetical protein